MKTLTTLVILAIFALASCKIHKLGMKRIETREESFRKEYFYRQFQKHTSFEKFLESNKHKQKFLSKHKASLKSYWHSYLVRSRKFKNILKKMNTDDQNVIATLQNQFVPQGLYSVNVSIGTPAQVLNLQLDTGSSDLWVTSNLCPNCSSPKNFYQNNSSTYKTDIQTGFAITYEDNSMVVGMSGTDVVSVAGVQADNFVTNVIYYEIGMGNATDGLIGFGPKNISSACDHSPTFLQTLKAQGKVENAVFSLYLGSENNNNPELVIGGYDESHFIAPLKYYNVYIGNGWQVDFGGVTVNGKTFVPRNTNNQALFDSGTTLIVGPHNFITEILEAIGLDESDDFNLCGKDTSNLPTLHFNIGGDDYPITSSEYTAPLPQDPQCRALTRENNLNQGPFSVTILGDSFIQVYYVVYDYDNKRAGLARAK